MNTWEFEGFESCNEGEVLKFIPTSGDTQIANYNIGIAVDSNHTHTDCNVGGDTFVDGVNTTPLGEGNKWVAYVQFEGDFYRENDLKTHPNDSSKHLKSIERPIIESLYTTATVEIWNNNINNVSLGNASCKGFKLERPYIANCVFNEMRWTTTSGTEDCTCYLKVTLNDTRGKEICSYFSNNTESFNITGLKSFRFDEDIEITDKIGSITCEISLDGINVVTTENKRIRVASVGTSANNTSDGSELTNANIITHVIFYGNEATSLLTGHIGDDTHLTTSQKNTISDCTNLNYTTILESEATESGEFDAVHFNYQDVPHDFHIKKFILKPVDSKNTPLYMAVWTLTQSGQKTFVGLSDEAITWEAGKDAVWTFNNVELIVPTNHDVEFFLCTGADAVGETEADVPGVYIKTKYNPNGRGTIRHSNNWHGRCVQATFSNNGYLSHVGDDTHLTTIQKETLNEVISGGFVTKDEFSELLEQSSQKQQYYDTWTNLKDGDIVDKEVVYSFQLDKNDFTTGRIDRIEIPYVDGNNSNGYLCVQFFDSSNSVIATHYSINKQKQDKTGSNVRGICEYEFSTFETPADYSYVRFSMVANNWTVPTGNSGIQFRIIPIKRNNTFTWNTNTNTKVNNTGTRWTILLSVLTRNYAKNTGITVRSYDWTPDVFCPINVILSTADTAFVAPTNGWIISKSTQTTSGANSLTLNGVEIAKSSGTSQADVQILIRKGEFITATTAYDLVFYPCKSEQFDYRLEGGHTPYDIWKGAVVYDEYGQPSVKDLYIPDASAWKTEVGSAVTGKIATISGEEALDSNGDVLFNIQSGYIENGRGMFVQSTITSFTSTLDVLSNGTQMFGYSGLTQWNVNLPNLVTGDCMFMGCGSLTSFSADLHSLSSGWYFLANCTNLTDVAFVGGLDALTDGTYMFKGCSLSYTSLTNILNALPTRNGNVIEITVADSVANDMVDDERFTDAEIPPFSGSTYFSFTHNGWEVRLTSQTGFVVGTLAQTPYDVTEQNGYIPDASGWNEVMGYAGLNIIDNITRVSNEVAYNDNN